MARIKRAPEECVRAGMAFLDKKIPGWLNMIVLKRLKMTDCYYCILGQLFGQFALGKFSLELSDRREAELGLNAYRSELNGRDDEHWHEVISCWPKMIKERRREEREKKNKRPAWMDSADYKKSGEEKKAWIKKRAEENMNPPPKDPWQG